MRGWIRNRYGRKYRLPSTLGYKGVNYLVQGTSADIMNERLIAVHKLLQGTSSHVILQVHDEIICEIHDSEMEILPKQIAETLEVNSLQIPLFVDIEVCTPSWATKIDWSKYRPTSPSSDIMDYIDWSDVEPREELLAYV